MEDVEDIVFGLGIPVAFFGYFYLQYRFVRYWEDGWRLLAGLPLVPLTALLLHAGVAFAMGSNLWPLLLILYAPVGFLYLLGLAGLRALIRQRDAA